MARVEGAAEEAYRAYAASLNYRGPDGTPMPSWYGLRPEEQEAWEAVADTLMDEVVLVRQREPGKSQLMNVGGLDPGVRYCGVAVVTDRGVEGSDLWTLPVQTTQACARLHALMEAWILSYNLEVVAVEDFHFHRQRGHVTTAKAMWQLLGVVRSLAGYRDVEIMMVQAGHWGRQLTGVRPPREQPGRRWDEWKRQVAWHVEQQAGPSWSWVNDRGYHRRDSLGIAYYARAELRFRGEVAGALARQGKGPHERLPPRLR